MERTVKSRKKKNSAHSKIYTQLIFFALQDILGITGGIFIKNKLSKIWQPVAYQAVIQCWVSGSVFGTSSGPPHG